MEVGSAKLMKFSGVSGADGRGWEELNIICTYGLMKHVQQVWSEVLGLGQVGIGNTTSKRVSKTCVHKEK